MLLSLIGCEFSYYPTIVNDGFEPIEISVTGSFNNNPVLTFNVWLAAESNSGQSVKGFKITQIKVREQSGNVRVYDAADLSIARSRQNIKDEVWILTKNGLRLGDEKDFKKISEKWASEKQ